MISQMAISPGLFTLMHNLVQTCDRTEIGAGRLNAWEDEYIKGWANKLFRVNLPKSFSRLPFSKAVRLVFKAVHCILIAFEVGEVVLVNPAQVLRLWRPHVRAQLGRTDQTVVHIYPSCLCLRSTATRTYGDISFARAFITHHLSGRWNENLCPMVRGAGRRSRANPVQGGFWARPHSLRGC